MVVIGQVRTQGRWDKGRGMEFPQAFMVEYWRESLGRWARYKDVHGNEVNGGERLPRVSSRRILRRPRDQPYPRVEEKRRNVPNLKGKVSQELYGTTTKRTYNK